MNHERIVPFLAIRCKEVCNMGAEVGATTSLFPFSPAHVPYLEATHRGSIAHAAQNVASAPMASIVKNGLPPKPPAALLPCPPPALVATGLAWLQPPNSSSCWTLKPPALCPNPAPPPTLPCFAGAVDGDAISPQPESKGVCIAGGGAGLKAVVLAAQVCIGAGAAG